MRLPNGDQAVVDVRKLREYCLSPTHPRGRHKARVFAAVLGVELKDAELLRNALLKAAETADAVPGRTDRYGDRFIVDFEMTGPSGKGIVRSLWMVRTGEIHPGMVTCFVL